MFDGEVITGSARVTELTTKFKEERFMKDQVRGKAEEMKGKVTGDKSEELKGKARQTVGKAKSKVRDIQADVKEEVHKPRDYDGDGERERI
jgi:uncharacterized protein YjbJ (UPF0337 family)